MAEPSPRRIELSRLGWSASLAVALSLTSLSCRFKDRPVGWIEPGSAPVPAMGCLDGASDRLARYLEGNESGTSAREVFTCATSSLQMFTRVIAGEKPGTYSVRDLRNFAQVFVLKKFQLTDSLLTEILTVKRALLGGNNATISASDLARVQKVLDLIGKHAELLAQDQPMTIERARTWPPERLDAAVARMTEAGDELASWLSETSGTYRFQEFLSLLDHLERDGAFEGEDAHKLLLEIRRWLPFVRAAKALIVDGNSDQIASQDWGLLVRLAVRAYTLTLRVDHFRLKATDWVGPEDRYELMGMARNALALFTDALKRRANPWITFEEFDTLIDLMPMDIPIKRRTLKNVLRPIVLKLFGPTAPAVGPGVGPTRPIGIQLSTLKQIQTDLELWAQTQDEIDRLYLNREPKPRPPLAWEAPSLHIPLDEIQRRLASLAPAGGPRILFADTEPRSYRIFLGRANWNEPLHYWEWTVRNWTRMLTKVAIRGYTPRTEDPAPRELAWPEFRMLFRDFEPLLQESGMLDPAIPIEDITLDEQFQLGDMVNFTSDSNQKLNDAELADQLVTLFSARDLGYDLQARVQARCHTPVATCVRQTLVEELDFIYSNFPQLAREWRSWAFKDRLEILKKIEFLAFKRHKADHEKYIYAELLGIGAALHQLEFIYGRYDINQDGIINYGEAQRGVPIFGRSLQEMARKQGGAMGGLIAGPLLEGLLTFIIANDAQATAWNLIPWTYITPIHVNNTHVKRIDLIRRFAQLRETNPL